MTLLEAVIACVLLAVVGVVCLDQSRGASQLQASSAQWDRAVALGESALAAATQGELGAGDAFAEAQTRGNAGTMRTDVQVSRRPWRDGIDLVEVTVSIPGDKSFTLSRLTARGRSTSIARAANVRATAAP